MHKYHNFHCLGADSLSFLLSASYDHNTWSQLGEPLPRTQNVQSVTAVSLTAMLFGWLE